MQEFFEKLKQLRHSLLPDPAWLLHVKAELLIFMGAHPVLEKHVLLARPLPWLFPRLAWTLAGGILVLGFVVGSHALAHGTLPGDTLYSVKRRVFEPVERFVANSNPESNAKFQLALVRRRLGELEMLVARGRDRAHLAAGLSQDTERETKRVGLAIEMLRQRGQTLAAQEAGAEFTALLRVHAGALAALAGKSGLGVESAHVLAELSQRIAGVSEAALLERMALDATAASQPADENKILATATSKLNQARRSVASRERELDPVTRKRARDQLAKAEERLAKARQGLEAKELGSALARAQESLTTAVETATLVEIAAPLRLRVRVREPAPPLEEIEPSASGDLNTVATSSDEVIELVTIEETATSSSEGGER